MNKYIVKNPKVVTMMSGEEILEEIERFGESDRYERFVKTCIRKDKHISGDPAFYRNLSDWYGSVPFNLLGGAVLKQDRFFLRTFRRKFHMEHSEYLRDLIYLWYLSYQDNPTETAEAVRWTYGIYGKILTAFENFQDCMEIEFPDIGVYERINDMGWEKDARKLRDRFCKKRDNVTQINYGMKLGDEYGNIAYVWELEKGVDYIAAFRASRDLRTEIIREDVLSAWSTYIHFINSDLYEIPLPPEPTREEVVEYLKSIDEIKGVKPIVLFREVDKEKERVCGD